jgi:hypothetical protein
MMAEKAHQEYRTDTLCLLNLMPMARSSKMVFVAQRPSLPYGTRRRSSSSLSRKSIEHTDHEPAQLLIPFTLSLYLAQFVESLFSAVQSNLNPYITSSFGEHGLTAVVSIVASITGGVCNLFIAKILDIWGRVEGFFCMLLLIVVGSIMKAACHNIETYAAANTIYWVSGPYSTSRVDIHSC